MVTSPWGREFSEAEADGEGERLAARKAEYEERFGGNTAIDLGAGTFIDTVGSRHMAAPEFPFTTISLGCELTEEEVRRLLAEPLHGRRRGWWAALRSVSFVFTPFTWEWPRVDRSVSATGCAVGPFGIVWDRP